MRRIRDWSALLRRATIALALALLGASVYIALNEGPSPVFGSGSCELTVGSGATKLSNEQAENAALIAAISVRRRLPPRAAAIAIATAMQESKLINVQHGDRDSLGLFQQRPSQGWGTAEQILDPVYSTKRFYSALVKVPDYLTLPITEAAQAVQRSAFPDAYAAHEDTAIALAGALTGQSPGALTCSVRGGPVQPDASSRLTAISDDLATGFGPVVSVTRSGDSLRIEVSGKRQRRHAWAVASYLVARARILDVDQVSVGHRGWQRSSGVWASAAHQDTGSVVVAARGD